MKAGSSLVYWVKSHSNYSLLGVPSTNPPRPQVLVSFRRLRIFSWHTNTHTLHNNIYISKAANSYNLWSLVWRLCQCHMRSIHHRVMTTPTPTIVVTFGIGNWDILGWYLGFVLVSCSLGVRPSGRRSRFHHGRWGWRSSPSALNQVSSSQFLQLVKRCESGGSILQFAETFSPTFFQALKWPSSGTLRDFITWRRWIDSVQFDLSSAWTCLTWFWHNM